MYDSEVAETHDDLSRSLRMWAWTFLLCLIGWVFIIGYIWFNFIWG